MSMAYPGLTHCSECGESLNGGIGICESCRQAKYGRTNKYKVGDIVKLSTGDKGIVKDVKLEKVYYPSPIYGKDEVKEEYKYKCEIENDDTYNLYEKEIIGLWEEKHVAQIIFETMNNNDNFPKKIKLIDVLNKIANGKLKEGTKVIWNNTVFEYIKNINGNFDIIFASDVSKSNNIFEFAFMENLNDEVELIEPQEPTECNHIWDNRLISAFSKEKGEIVKMKECRKCGKWEEPTDNTKIEELNVNNYGFDNLGIITIDIFDKLNEVIRYINKENNNE